VLLLHSNLILESSRIKGLYIDFVLILKWLAFYCATPYVLYWCHKLNYRQTRRSTLLWPIRPCHGAMLIRKQ